MRDIKVKYYVDIGNEIVSTVYTLDQIEQRIFTHDKRYEIARCQFTGLIDKNGTEVYEGDIIRLFDNDNGFLEVVFRNEYVGGWNLLFEGKTTSLGARKSFEIEIVGNIHE